MRRDTPRRAVRSEAVPDAEALATRRRRAVEEPLDVRLRSSEPFVDLEVRNPVHRTSYRVLFPEYPARDSALCTCTDFARRGLGTCKHVEAGWSWLEGQPTLTGATPTSARPHAASGLWNEIGRRLGALVRSGPTTIRDVEAPGTLLYEEPAPEKPKGEGGETVGRSRGGRPPSTSTSRARP
ncbi:MAG TPA: hypothetical protein VEH10_01450 [Thermoplasmata archaeon]|nr:hypothetical protein [Thermoplasmata archaeon]